MSTTNKKSRKVQSKTSESIPAKPIAESSKENELASFDELKELVSKKVTKDVTEDIDDQRQSASAQEMRERETHRVGEEEYYRLRNKWSWFIFSFIAFMLLFQLFLTLAIGYKWAEFKDYPVFLHLVIGENFAQIIGMGIIVAKFLFPHYRSRKDNDPLV